MNFAVFGMAGSEPDVFSFILFVGNVFSNNASGKKGQE